MVIARSEVSVLSLAAARAGCFVVVTSTAVVVDGALLPVADLTTGLVTARQTCCSVSLLDLCWLLAK